MGALVVLLLLFSLLIVRIYYSVKSYKDSKELVDEIMNSQEVLFLSKGVIRYGYSGGSEYFILNEIVDVFLCPNYLVLLPKPNNGSSYYSSLVLFKDYSYKKFYKKFAFKGKVISHRIDSNGCFFFKTISKNHSLFFLFNQEIEYKIVIEDVDKYFIEKLDEIFD